AAMRGKGPHDLFHKPVTHQGSQGSPHDLLALADAKRDIADPLHLIMQQPEQDVRWRFICHVLPPWISKEEGLWTRLAKFLFTGCCSAFFRLFVSGTVFRVCGVLLEEVVCALFCIGSPSVSSESSCLMV